MDIDEKLSLTNTFAGGVDSDTSDLLMKDSQYRLARNLRYITDVEENSGELHLIDGAERLKIRYNYANEEIDQYPYKILKTATIRDYGIIIALGPDDAWRVDAFKLDSLHPDRLDIYTSFGPCTAPLGDVLSVATRFEDDNNVKLYIADGLNPLMSINVADGVDKNGTNIRNIIAYSNGILLPPTFCGWIAGSLKSGMVLYAYMLYHKHGKITTMSPITKMILIPKDYNLTGKDVEGADQNKETSCGILLKVIIEDEDHIDISYYNNILVYRVNYTANGQTPTVELIIDKPVTSREIPIRDVGQDALSSLTLEEFNSISGIHIIPKIIESKNDYLFAANIKDSTYDSDLLKIGDEKYDARAFQYTYDEAQSGTTTVYDYNSGTRVELKDGKVPEDSDAFNMRNDLRDGYDSKYYNRQFTKPINGVCYYGGSGKYISWRFVIADIDGDTCKTPSKVGTQYNIQSLDKVNTTDELKLWYPFVAKLSALGDGETVYTTRLLRKTDVNLKELGISSSENNALNYSNPIVSYAFKSLKRGELYRYGIVFYDEDNHPSPVQWIADIRVPELYEDCFETFMAHGDNNVDLTVRPIGVEFSIQAFPDKAVAYEIVRCNRTEHDVKSISQGVVSRPIKKATPSNRNLEYPYTPSGFITTNKFIVTERNSFYEYGTDVTLPDSAQQADNVLNDRLFLYISPEYSYLKDSMSTMVKDMTLKLEPLTYMWGASANARKSPELYLAAVHDDSSYDIKHKGPDIIKPSVTNLNLMLGAYWGNMDREALDFQYPQLHDGLNDSYKNNCHAFNTATVVASEIMNHQFLTVDPHYYKEGTWGSHDNLITGGARNLDVTPGKYDSNRAEMQTCRKPDKSPYTRNPSSFDGFSNDDKESIEVFSIKHEDAYKIAHDVYAYIKLYELNPHVVGYAHKTNSPGVYCEKTLYPDYDSPGSIIDGWLEYPLGDGRVYEKLREIKAIKPATELNWDDAKTQSTEKDSEYSWTYFDKADAVGSATFNNWVSWHKYAQDSTLTEPLAYDGDLYGAGTTAGAVMMGPGGRCMLIDTKPNDLDGSDVNTQFDPFSDVSGTPESLCFTTNGNTRYISANKAYTTSTDYTSALLNNRQKKTYTYVWPESSMGTVLCNITHSVTPYGGYDYLSRQLNTYYSYGDYHMIPSKRNVTCTVFDGDCYIQPFEYVSLHKQYMKEEKWQYQPAFCVVYSIPVETNINLTLVNGYEFSKHYNDLGVTNLQNEPANVKDILVQSDPLYRYNTAYSLNPTSKLFEADSENANELSTNNLDYRVYYSNLKSNDERQDSWLVFMPANFIDVDTRYGAITLLKTFHNQLMFWLELAVGLLSVNERVEIADKSNMPLILGTGGVLTRYDYLSSANGMSAGLFSDAQSDSTLMWWDENRNEICGYAGDGKNVLIVSKAKSIQNFINKNHEYEKTLFSTTTTPIDVSYDKKFNEFLFNIGLKCTLVYSEMAQQFTGVYDIIPEHHFTFKDRLLFDKWHVYLDETPIRTGCDISLWNRTSDKTSKGLTGEPLLPYIKYVVNKSGELVKVFDQCEFGGRFNYSDKNSRGVDSLSFEFRTPLMLNSKLDGKDITDREYSFRFAIPRNNNEDWGNRMRGKTMLVELSSNNNSTDFSIQYITTKFRSSWS